MDNLWGDLEASPARHSLLVVDSCYGGLLARSRKLEQNPGPAVIAGLLSRRARQVLTAGSRDEEAWENPNLGHGAFTSKLLEELKARAKAPNQVFLASELAARLKVSVGDLTGGKQTPQFGNYGGTEGEFLFVSTPPRPVAALPKIPESGGPVASPAPVRPPTQPARSPEGEKPASPPATAPSVAAGPAAWDVASLHPAFRLSPEDIARAVAVGQEEAKRGRTRDQLFDRYKRKPKWVRGKGGTVHESAVWCFGIEGNTFSISAFSAATLYEPLNLTSEARTRGHVVSELRFQMVLTSIPKAGQTQRAAQTQIAAALANIANPKKESENNAQIIKETVVTPGDPKDVRVVKFVLSDDKGRSCSGRVRQSEDTSTTIKVPIVRPAKDGERAVASGASEEEVPPGHVLFYEEHRVHQMRYSVEFPLFDEDGKARIRPDAKKIVLHIVTENGEQVVDYDLRKMGRN